MVLYHLPPLLPEHTKTGTSLESSVNKISLDISPAGSRCAARLSKNHLHTPAHRTSQEERPLVEALRARDCTLRTLK